MEETILQVLSLLGSDAGLALKVLINERIDHFSKKI